MKRKLLSLILVFAMTVSLLTVGTGAVEPTYGDTAGHWAESSIERWSGHGIVQGSSGEFDPNGQLTCAQLATILAKLLKLPAAKDAGFTDNTADAWYYDAVNRCAAAGILNGNGDGTVSPTAPITRERAMVMLGRALGIQPIENPDLSKHSDATKVSDYAQGMVAAMIEAGIVTGVNGDQIAPQDDINRASTVTILDRAIAAYADQAGETIKGDGKGVILVVAENVTITGDVDTLLVAAPEATVTLDGANAKNVSVNGEGGKLVLNNSEVGNVAVSGANTEIETKGSSKVEKVDVTEDAKGASINAGSGTTIGAVDSKADNVGISGDGKVGNASVSGNNTKVDTKDTKVDVAEGVTGTTAGGKEVAGGTTAETPAAPSTPSGGSSSGGSSSGGSSSGGGSTPSHTHVWATEWSHNETHHWHDCTAANCTVSSNADKDGYAEHTFEGDVCTECGFTKCVEVWTGYSGTKVASYATVAEAAAALGANKWIVIARDHTLTEDFEIKDGVYLDVAKDASLTVAEGVTLTVASDAKRLGVRAEAALVNNGTILVCGSSTANGFAMLYGTMSGNGLTVPAGRFLDNNGKNFFATADEDAIYEITYGDGTVKKTADSTNIRGGSITQIRLLSDATGGWTLDNTVYSVGPEAVLDLNGHTISYSGANPNYSTLNIYTKVTVKNGTIRYEGSKRGAMEVLGQGKLTIGSDVTVDGGSSFGIFTSGTSQLTVNGTVKANGNYAIAGNGSRDKGGYIDSCDITVNEGARIEAPNGIAIYHPEKGTVTINGGTISGHTGVELCAGRLTVSGGSITSTGDNWDATGSQNAIKDGAAVSIINRDYPGGTPTAEITGGVFTASGSGAQTVKAYDYRSNAVAEWMTAGESVNISGGSFSSIPGNMSALCADGYEAKEAGGKWTVQIKSQPGGETGTPVGAVSNIRLVKDANGIPVVEWDAPADKTGITAYTVQFHQKNADDAMWVDAGGAAKNSTSCPITDGDLIAGEYDKVRVISGVKRNTGYVETRTDAACTLTFVEEVLNSGVVTFYERHSTEGADIHSCVYTISGLSGGATYRIELAAGEDRTFVLGKTESDGTAQEKAWQFHVKGTEPTTYQLQQIDTVFGENGSCTVTVQSGSRTELARTPRPEAGVATGYTISGPDVGAYFSLSVTKPANKNGILWYDIYGQTEDSSEWQKLGRQNEAENEKGTAIEFYKLDGKHFTKLKIVSYTDRDSIYENAESEEFACDIQGTSAESTAMAAFTETNGTYSVTVSGMTRSSMCIVFSTSASLDGELGHYSGLSNDVVQELSAKNLTNETYYCIYEFSNAAVDSNGKATVTVAKTAWRKIAQAGSRASLLPSGIKLGRSNAGGLTLQMTKSAAADKIKEMYSLQYEIACGNQTNTYNRGLNPTTVSTDFITDYSNLFAGANTVKVTFKATPTDEAKTAGYVEESITFTATVAYTKNETVSRKGIAAQLTAPAEGPKTLTVTGLKAEQGYRIAVQVGEGDTVNYREGVTNGEGTFTSTWYTDYAFDRCTICEWTVSGVTETTASIVCTPYSGSVDFT